VPSPTPPPPLPDPDDDLPARAPRRRQPPQPRPADGVRSGGARGGGGGGSRRHPSLWSQLSPRAWAIIVAVLAVVLVLIVGAAAGGGGKKKTSGITTDAAVSTLQSLLDGVDKDTVLGSCPFGTVASIVDDVHDAVKVNGRVTDALHKIVIGGKDSVDEVLCSAATDDDRLHVVQSMYVYATPAPKGSYTDYLSKTLLSGAKFDGGTIYAWCVSADVEFRSGCGADWVAGDNKLVLGMQLTGGAVTAKQITTALQHELKTLADRLGGDEATGSIGSTVPHTAGSDSAPDSAPDTGPDTRPSTTTDVITTRPTSTVLASSGTGGT
jgi:hypothetical protein